VSAPSRIPAKLYWNPTSPDSATESDWGTYLGDFDNLIFYLGRDGVIVSDQIWGGEVEEVVTYQKAWITVLMRDIKNKNALKLMFPEVTTNDTAALTPTLDPLIADTAEIGGRRLSSYGGKLLLRPRDADEHLAVYFYNAVATIPSQAQMDFEIEKEWGLPIIFRAFVDSDGKKLKIGNTDVVAV